jgi:hypothetical protein
LVIASCLGRDSAICEKFEASTEKVHLQREGANFLGGMVRSGAPLPKVVSKLTNTMTFKNSTRLNEKLEDKKKKKGNEE